VALVGLALAERLLGGEGSCLCHSGSTTNENLGLEGRVDLVDGSDGCLEGVQDGSLGEGSSSPWHKRGQGGSRTAARMNCKALTAAAIRWS